MTEMNRIDIDLCLLSGRPIDINGIMIYPITFNQIAEIKYSLYSKAIWTFCITIDQFNQIFEQQLEQQYLYGCLCMCSVENLNIRNDILLILSLVTRDTIDFDEINKAFIIHDKILDSKTFLQIQEVVKIRNGLESIEEDKDNPADEATRRLIEQRNKYRKKLRELKNNSESDNITLVDLLSTLAVGLHLDLKKVYEYDMYQLNDQINRLKIFKDYDTNVQALLHGANNKDVDLKYWMSSNKKNNNSDSDESFNSDDYDL